MFEQALLVEHHRILERSTERKPGTPQPRHVIHEPESPGAANLAAEPFGGKVERVFLVADHGVDEIDLDLGAEARRMGPQFAERIAHRDLHRLQYLDEAARRRLRNDSGLIDRGDEGRGAAVHDRHFRTVDLDGGIVDAHAAQRSQHMLCGGNQWAVTVAQNGREFGGDHRFRGRLNLAVTALKAGADKNKTCIHRCRPNGKIDW